MSGSSIWTLWADWSAATERDALIYDEDALGRFWASLRLSESTRIKRTHELRRAFEARQIPVPPLTPSRMSAWRVGPAWAPLEQALAAIPTAGWPHGFRGRRDAFLSVCLHEGLTRDDIRFLGPKAISWRTPGELVINGSSVPISDDPDSCAACAVARWMKAIALADIRGRGSLRQTLILQQDRRVNHVCQEESDDKWQNVHWTLVPAIDRYGWIDTGRSMSARSISAVVAYRQAIPFLRLPTETRPKIKLNEEQKVYADLDADASIERVRRAESYPEASMTELFDMVDDQFDAADEIMARIEAQALAFEEEMQSLSD